MAKKDYVDVEFHLEYGSSVTVRGVAYSLFNSFVKGYDDFDKNVIFGNNNEQGVIVKYIIGWRVIG